MAMQVAIFFKILQKRNWYRNRQNLSVLPTDFIYTEEEYNEARDYILRLGPCGISYTYPQHPFYPEAFLKMKEPPLFLEYIGEPYWMQTPFLAVVGSREISPLTERWMQTHLSTFLSGNNPEVGVVSGGARGVDQIAHLTAIKCRAPTVVMLPTGLDNMYPQSLQNWRDHLSGNLICFMSEFARHEKIHKAHFYFRNRLIAALGRATLVTQSTLKSGSLLTVHHSLESGRPVLTVPSHPEINGFEGNLRLLQDGAFLVTSGRDLLDFWKSESSSSQSFTSDD